MKHQKNEQRVGGRISGLASLAVLFLLCACVIPGRAAVQPFRPVDLSALYTTAFSNAPEPMPFPRGDQTFEGVPFRIGGRIELTGMEAARHGAFLPAEVTGIPVGQTVRRFHLLVGALYGRRDG